MAGKIRQKVDLLFQNWLTIVIIPQKSSKVIKFKAPKPLLLIGLGTLGLLVAVGLYGLANSFYLSQKMTDYQALQTRYLENQVSIRKVSNKLGTITDQIERMRELDYKLRVISDLEVDRPSPSVYGIGGSLDTQKVASLSNLDVSKVDLLTLLEKDISRLKEMADYQEESFNNLRDFLSDKKDLLQRTPHRWPLNGFLSSTYGYRLDPFTGLQKKHEGIDIVNQRGSEITAPADGIITFAGNDPTLGHLLVIDHGYGIITRYGHNDKLLVREGQRVKRGDPITLLGSSGKSTGPHLHYEIRINDVAVNPLNYMMK